MQIAGEGVDILKVVGGMEQKGWRLLGVNHPPAIHLTVDVMQSTSLDKFILDLSNVTEDVCSGKMDQEGLLSYGGVGAEEDAPKWLLNAVEYMGAADH